MGSDTIRVWNVFDVASGERRGTLKFDSANDDSVWLEMEDSPGGMICFHSCFMLLDDLIIGLGRAGYSVAAESKTMP